MIAKGGVGTAGCDEDVPPITGASRAHVVPDVRGCVQ